MNVVSQSIKQALLLGTPSGIDPFLKLQLC